MKCAFSSLCALGVVALSSGLDFEMSTSLSQSESKFESESESESSGADNKPLWIPSAMERM